MLDQSDLLYLITHSAAAFAISVEALGVVLCLPRRSCEVGCVTYTSTSCGVTIASLSECLVCKSKCLEYSGKDDMHVAVAFFFLVLLSLC